MIYNDIFTIRKCSNCNAFCPLFFIESSNRVSIVEKFPPLVQNSALSIFLQILETCKNSDPEYFIVLKQDYSSIKVERLKTRLEKETNIEMRVLLSRFLNIVEEAVEENKIVKNNLISLLTKKIF